MKLTIKIVLKLMLIAVGGDFCIFSQKLSQETLKEKIHDINHFQFLPIELQKMLLQQQIEYISFEKFHLLINDLLKTFHKCICCDEIASFEWTTCDYHDAGSEGAPSKAKKNETIINGIIKYFQSGKKYSFKF